MTRATVRIPTPLRGFTKGRDEVVVDAASVGEALAALDAGLRERVLDASGNLRPFVNVYVGSDDVRTLQGLSTRLKDGAVLSIVPAVAGGAAPRAGFQRAATRRAGFQRAAIRCAGFQRAALRRAEDPR